MYRLKKYNVERVVLDETTRDILIDEGFELLNENKETDNKDDSKNLENMTIEELKEYAEENGIDIGKATSQSGILEKIKEHEDE